MTSRDHAGPQISGSTHRRTLALNRIVLSATRCSPPECGLDGPVPVARLRVDRHDNVSRAGASCVGCYLRLDALVGLNPGATDPDFGAYRGAYLCDTPGVSMDGMDTRPDRSA